MQKMSIKKEGIKEIKRKQNLKSKNGITLIALVITIIVLLILAGVSIAMLTGENGILTQANNSKQVTERAEAKERAQLDVAAYVADEKAKGRSGELNDSIIKGILTGKDYVSEAKDSSFISKKGNHEIPYSELYGTGSSENPGGGTGNKPETDENGIYKENSTVNGEEIGTADNPTVPAGFRPMDTDTSTWGDGTNPPTEESVKNGLVITDSTSDDVLGNEFVWVPVPEPSEMYGTDKDGKKWGKLYEFTSATESEPNNWTEQNGVMSITNMSGNASFREPDIVSDYDNMTSFLTTMKNILGTSYRNSEQFKADLEKDFNNMIASVEKYHGFYVGRYETSYNKTTVQSKKGEKSAQAFDTNTYKWYGLYARQKKYSTSSVQGSMIYGSQWDAMLKWMQKNGINVTSRMPIAGISKNTGSTTGIVETDKLNNVYDILGNRQEWTIEAYSTDKRVGRGGSFFINGTPSGRSYSTSPGTANGIDGSRLSLYIK